MGSHLKEYTVMQVTSSGLSKRSGTVHETAGKDDDAGRALGF
jgi:hypothetical protein